MTGSAPNTDRGRRKKPSPEDTVTLTARVKRRLRDEVKIAALEEGRTTEEWVLLAVRARLNQTNAKKRQLPSN